MHIINSTFLKKHCDFGLFQVFKNHILIDLVQISKVA